VTIAAFMAGALLRLLDNPEPVVLFSAIITGTFLPPTHVWVYGALLAVVLLNKAIWNAPVARVFTLESSRAAYVSLKTILHRTFGGLLALAGVKLVRI
jgi:threonine/homoserine/homoserine lactone efflux protein